MIQVIKRNGIHLLFDDLRNATYRIASPTAAIARQTIPRAYRSTNEDWLDETTLTRALRALDPKALKL